MPFPPTIIPSAAPVIGGYALMVDPVGQRVAPESQRCPFSCGADSHCMTKCMPASMGGIPRCQDSEAATPAGCYDGRTWKFGLTTERIHL